MNLAIFFCYPGIEGIIRRQTIDVIRQLKKISDRMIIVSNGMISDKSKADLGDISEEIVERENIGLDFGGYSHIILEYIGFEELNSYEALILCNDTFYGFFTPIEEIYKKMHASKLDIWGLNKVERGILDLIQSYFLVFDKRTFSDLYIYFRDNKINENDYGKVVAYLESKLYIYFKQRGYKIGTWTNTNLIDIYTYPDVCIKEYHLPILKNKCFIGDNCSSERLLDLVDWLKKNKSYNDDYFPNIGNNTICTFRKKLKKAAITEEELLDFAERGLFYIFGGGNIAKEIYYTYFENNSNFVGFVVSNNEETDYLSIKQLPKSSRVIIAVKDSSQPQVESIMPKDCIYIKLWDI